MAQALVALEDVAALTEVHSDLLSALEGHKGIFVFYAGGRVWSLKWTDAYSLRRTPCGHVGGVRLHGFFPEHSGWHASEFRVHCCKHFPCRAKFPGVHAPVPLIHGVALFLFPDSTDVNLQSLFAFHSGAHYRPQPEIRSPKTILASKMEELSVTWGRSWVHTGAVVFFGGLCFASATARFVFD
jgi:hypothetical protein